MFLTSSSVTILVFCVVRPDVQCLPVWVKIHDIHGNSKLVTFCQNKRICFFYMVIESLSGMLYCCY